MAAMFACAVAIYCLAGRRARAGASDLPGLRATESRLYPISATPGELPSLRNRRLPACPQTRLRVTDIDSARSCIRVDQGKGRKDRYVPLAPRLLAQLRAYWCAQRPLRWLFPGTMIDQPMSRDSAWRIYVKARDKAGITKGGGLHLLRHCFATHLLEAGTELVVIQRLMGHTSIRSTLRYRHLAQAHTAATTSPLELLEFPRPQSALSNELPRTPSTGSCAGAGGGRYRARRG